MPPIITDPLASLQNTANIELGFFRCVFDAPSFFKSTPNLIRESLIHF